MVLEGRSATAAQKTPPKQLSPIRWTFQPINASIAFRVRPGRVGD